MISGARCYRASRARAIVAHVARDVLIWPTNEVAAALRVSNSAVVHASAKGQALLAAAGQTPAGLLRSSGVGWL